MPTADEILQKYGVKNDVGTTSADDILKKYGIRKKEESLGDKLVKTTAGLLGTVAPGTESVTSEIAPEETKETKKKLITAAELAGGPSTMFAGESANALMDKKSIPEALTRGAIGAATSWGLGKLGSAFTQGKKALGRWMVRPYLSKEFSEPAIQRIFKNPELTAKPKYTLEELGPAISSTVRGTESTLKGMSKAAHELASKSKAMLSLSPIKEQIKKEAAEAGLKGYSKGKIKVEDYGLPLLNRVLSKIKKRPLTVGEADRTLKTLDNVLRQNFNKQRQLGAKMSYAEALANKTRGLLNAEIDKNVSKYGAGKAGDAAFRGLMKNKGMNLQALKEPALAARRTYNALKPFKEGELKALREIEKLGLSYGGKRSGTKGGAFVDDALNTLAHMKIYEPEKIERWSAVRGLPLASFGKIGARFMRHKKDKYATPVVRAAISRILARQGNEQ